MKCAAVAGRSAGSLAIPVASTRSTRDGSPVPAALAEGTLSSTWARAWAAGWSAVNGRRPVSSSKATTASA
jgi:hypothetical protein